MERFFGKGLDDETKSFVRFPYHENDGPEELNFDGVVWRDNGEHGEFKNMLRSCFVRGGE